MDFLSDMIIRLKNNYIKKLSDVIILNSRYIFNILKIFYRLGYINGFTILNKKYLKVFLKYDNKGISVIKQIKRISTRNNRIYCKSSYYKLNKNILHNTNKTSGIFLITTPKGIITSNELIIYNCGGEIILYIS